MGTQPSASACGRRRGGPPILRGADASSRWGRARGTAKKSTKLIAWKPDSVGIKQRCPSKSILRSRFHPSYGSLQLGAAGPHPTPPPHFPPPPVCDFQSAWGKKKPMCSSSATKHTAGQRQTPGPPPSDQAPGVGCPPLLSSNAARLSRPMAASLLSRAMLSLGMITWARSLVIREIS